MTKSLEEIKWEEVQHSYARIGTHYEGFSGWAARVRVQIHHMLIEEITLMEIPKWFKKHIKVEACRGDIDPTKSLYAFITVLHPCVLLELWVRTLPWFQFLPPHPIEGWGELSTQFVHNFMTMGNDFQRLCKLWQRLKRETIISSWFPQKNLEGDYFCS